MSSSTPLLLVLFLQILLSSCLADLEEQVSEPLFRLLPAAHTGIDFNNQLFEDEQLNILTFEYFYNGAGVGIGDVNNDGLPDIFFSGNMVNSRLYLNKGNLQFEDVTESAGIDTEGKWVTGVSMVDLNGDGRLDIYIACAGPYGPDRRANQLYINNGNGTFTEQAEAWGLADTGHTTHAAFFDYDRDGDLDVYLLTNITGEVGPNVIRPKKTNGEMANTDRLYRNESPPQPSQRRGAQSGMQARHSPSLGGAAGVFVNVSDEAGILKEGYGLGVAIADFNQDGWPDIYVSNDYLSNDLLYINRRDGTFRDRAADFFRHTSYSAMGNDVADFNNDGLPDIAALDMLPPDNLRRKLMTGSINYDRFRSEMLTGYAPQYMRNTLQLHRGFAPDSSLVFSEIGQLAGIHSTDWSWSALFSDIDNDGWKDLLVTNGYPRDITNRDFASYKMNTIIRDGYDRNMQTSFLEALQSLDGAYLPNFAFRNRGNLTFEDASRAWGFTQPGYSTGAAVADLDRDGDLDYVVNNTNGEAFVYENQSAGANYLRVQLQGNAGNPQGFGAQIWVYAGGRRQFQECTPYRGFQSSVEPILHFGLGQTNTIDSLKIRWPDDAVQCLRNLPGNQVLTVNQEEAEAEKPAPVAETNPLFTDLSKHMGFSFQHKESHYADFKVQPLLPHKHSQQGPFLATGDMNGDGLDDFFVGGAFRQSGQLFFQRPGGAFDRRPLAEGDNFEEDLGALLFDADGDGDLDLYVCSGGSEFKEGSPYYQDRLYRNDGRGNFRLDPEALPTMPTSTTCVAGADYDGDGDIDLFAGGRIAPGNYADSPRSYLLENRSGRFVDVTDRICPDLQFPGRVSAARWTDVNSDRRPDLLLAGEWMPLTVFQNTGDGFAGRPLPHSTGWWNTLAAADLDGDGDTDFVAGNLGLNNPYQAGEQTPLRLHLNDFDRNGRRDALMTFHLQEEEVPVHFRDDLLQWLYPLKKKYRNYRSYAEAAWTDLFPAEIREQGVTLEVTQFASVWIENDKGAFHIRPLPVEAQFAPIHGILVDDFNRDGRPDILLSGNSYATETNTGRYDALNGLLLLGADEKRFAPVSTRESGFYLPGDGKGLAQIQLADGRILVLAARNDDQLKAFVVKEEVQ